MKKSSIKRFAALLCSTLLPLSANAAIVTLQSSWAGPGRTGVLTFSYDDTVVDSNPAAAVGTYQNAFTAATFLLNGTTTYTLATDQSSSIVIRPHLSIASPVTTTSFSMTFKDSDGFLHNLYFGNESPLVATDALSVLPGLKRSEAALDFEGVMFLNTPGQNVFTTVPSVPVPAAAWLFGSGLIALGGAARRRKAARQSTR